MKIFTYKQINMYFGRFASFLYDRPLKVLFFYFILQLMLISFIPQLRFNHALESFLHGNDSIKQTYNELREEFGSDQYIIVTIRQPKLIFPKLFRSPFLDTLSQLHTSFEKNLPYVDEVSSILNVRYTYGDQNQLVVEKLIKKVPTTKYEVSELLTKISSNPVYSNKLRSFKLSYPSIIIKLQDHKKESVHLPREFKNNASDINNTVLLSQAKQKITIQSLHSILEPYRQRGFDIYVSGVPILTDSIFNSIQHNLQLFIPISFVLIICVLWLLFRRVSGVILPLFIIITSLLSTLGAMALIGIPIQMITQILPSVLIAVGVADSVHVLSVFYKKLSEGLSKRQSIIAAFEQSGLAILLTTLTTFVGFGAFITADVMLIFELGICAPIGVFFAFLSTIVLLPVLISLIPIRKSVVSFEIITKKTESFLLYCTMISIRYPFRIMFVTIVIFAGSLIGMAQLSFTHNPLNWFKEGAPVKVATKTIDYALGGTVALEVILDTQEKGGVYNPQFLNRLDKSYEVIRDVFKPKINVGEIISLADLLKEVHQALNNNQSKFYHIPQDRDIVSKELLLFKNTGSGDLESLVDEEYSKLKLTVFLPWLDAMVYSYYVDKLEDEFQILFGETCQIKISGLISVLLRTASSIIVSLTHSYLIAGVFITLLMMVMIRSIKLGFLSMLPNMWPICVVLGFMGWTNISFDISTMLVGSIGLGLVVDDTIHFMHNFRRYYDELGSAKDAVKETILTVGSALLFTTVILAVGFSVFMLADMANLIYFGLLNAMMIIIALVSDFFVVPAMMILLDSWGAIRPKRMNI